MAITDNPIVSAPSLMLLTPKIVKYLDDKADLFIKSNLYSAPIAEQVGILTGYNTIKTSLDCGGYCNMRGKEIAINSTNIRTVLHEVSHAFQSDMGDWHKLNYVLSDFFKGDQQCETMAKYLYEKIFKVDSGEIFNTYFNKEDLDFLRNWYKGSVIQCDI